MRDWLSEGLQEILNSVNGMGRDSEKAEKVVSIFSRTHRTLQQSFMRVVIVPILQHLASQHATGFIDGRNEASAALSAKMLAAVTEDDLYIPFV